jgi:hypothetical protein
MYQDEVSRSAFGQRFGAALDRTEQAYLRVLRAAILLLATILLVYVAWLGLNSLYKMSQSPDSVAEEEAVFTAEEITSAEVAASTPAAAANDEAQTNPVYREFYSNFLKRYYALYRAKFEPYRQPDDKDLTQDSFDDTFLDTPARLAAVTDGELDFESDKATLQGLLEVMSEAADKPLTRERLQKYKTAKKVQVTRKVQRTRTTYRDGWDSYSTSCEGWYWDPIGCPTRRAVETPYTATITTTEFPEGTQSHSQIFRAFQDRYLSLLQERKDANADEAARQRAEILAGNAEGETQLWTMVQIFGGFLALMFFFLLIAIERHQRRLAGVQSAEPGLPEHVPVPS